MPQDSPISHAEMIAALREAIDDYGFPHPLDERKIECLESVMAHLERTQWRPIEEAPKDGTTFLAYSANGQYRWLCHWSRQWNKWVHDYDGDPPADEYMPTQWCEIPPSPETP